MVSFSQGILFYQLNWQYLGGMENLLLNILAGFYELRVRDVNNCVVDFVWEVELFGLISLFVFDCNDFFVNMFMVDV